MLVKAAPVMERAPPDRSLSGEGLGGERLGSSTEAELQETLRATQLWLFVASAFGNSGLTKDSN